MSTKLIRKTSITQARLKELVHYEPTAGVFTRKVALSNGSGGLGTVLGKVMNAGYLRASVNGVSYLLHRLAFLYMTGLWPEIDVDHVNGIRTDNRWKNLRSVDRRTNSENRREVMPGKKGGNLLGTHKCSKNRWQSSITTKGSLRYLGTFETEEAAHQAYLKAKRSLHKGCTL